MTTLVPGSMSFGSDDSINWLQDYELAPIPFGHDDLPSVDTQIRPLSDTPKPAIS